MWTSTHPPKVATSGFESVALNWINRRHSNLSAELNSLIFFTPIVCPMKSPSYIYPAIQMWPCTTLNEAPYRIESSHNFYLCVKQKKIEPWRLLQSLLSLRDRWDGWICTCVISYSFGCDLGVCGLAPFVGYPGSVYMGVMLWEQSRWMLMQMGEMFISFQPH